MSEMSANLARQLYRFRQETGVPITFRGKTFRVRTEEVSGAKAGAQAVPQKTLGIYLAAAAPRMFYFSPQDFAPTTDEPLPQERETVIYSGLEYVLTHPDADAVGDDTVGLPMYGLRNIAGIGDTAGIEA